MEVGKPCCVAVGDLSGPFLSAAEAENPSFIESMKPLKTRLPTGVRLPLRIATGHSSVKSIRAIPAQEDIRV